MVNELLHGGFLAALSIDGSDLIAKGVSHFVTCLLIPDIIPSSMQIFLEKVAPKVANIIDNGHDHGGFIVFGRRVHVAFDTGLNDFTETDVTNMIPVAFSSTATDIEFARLVVRG